jgi:AbrB family looped-hinge helix DNA binding protein
MVQPVSVRIDEKGRLTLPRSLRDELHIQPGDTVFLNPDPETQTLHVAKAINPFDVLADHAVAEWRAGKTKSLRDFAREEGIELDGE